MNVRGELIVLFPSKSGIGLVSGASGGTGDVFVRISDAIVLRSTYTDSFLPRVDQVVQLLNKSTWGFSGCRYIACFHIHGCHLLSASFSFFVVRKERDMENERRRELFPVLAGRLSNGALQ